MMNSQEIETALRMKTPMVVLVWNDAEYGLITWHQLRHFGRPSHVAFKNPDFVKYAESFGAKGYRVERTADLLPTLTSRLSLCRAAATACRTSSSSRRACRKTACSRCATAPP